MRSSSFRIAFAFLILICHESSASSVAEPQRLQNVRPLNARASRLVRRGRVESETFRFLVDTIERSQIIVYISFDPHLESPMRAATRFMNAASDKRMILIVLNPRAVDDELVALLAHELQHANEIAAADVKTLRELETYFDAKGTSRTAHRYETTQALMVENTVRLELGAKRRNRAAKSSKLLGSVVNITGPSF